MQQVRHYQSFREQSQKSQQVWLRFLVATSGTVFAILISFADKTALAGTVRPVFGWAMVLLGCGILMLSIALYEMPFHDKKNLSYFLKEVQIAESEGGQTDVVWGYKSPAIFSICAKAGYIFLSASVLLLTVLSLLLYIA